MKAQDDNTDFTSIYGLYKPEMLKMAKRYVQDQATAEDIVSDSFISFYRNIGELPPKSNRTAYLAAIVRNNCLNFLIARKNHLKIWRNIHSSWLSTSENNTGPVPTGELWGGEESLGFEIHSIIRHTLEGLTRQERKVFEESRFKGRTYAEIARDCGIPVRRVTSIIQKVLSKMRVSLRDYLE